MKRYSQFINRKVIYILTSPRLTGPTADFMETGMALAGILRKEDTFDQFVERQESQTFLHMDKNKTLTTIYAQNMWRQKHLNNGTND